MAALNPSPLTTQPPPLPPGMDALTAGYLQQFLMWVNNQFASRLKSNSALPGIMLQANDAAAGATPAVFMLQVKTDGTLVTTPMTIGSGKP
jgi:hypothetical protein